MHIKLKIAVVIPCYKVTKKILHVIEGIGPEVEKIYVVDDGCPDGSGELVLECCEDKRVKVVFHQVNQGVGAAVMTGYRSAIGDGMDIIVKIDGDGQMNPRDISNFTLPILNNEADYTKGNRFYDIDSLESMPRIRIFGNAVLSFMSKLSSGYWGIFDPTNGFTAISSSVVSRIPLNKIHKRYFFESDMLFRLNIIRAVVVDIPMNASYSDEVSGLKIRKIIREFLLNHFNNMIKRIFYNYYLRDMSVASFELPIGLILLAFGLIFGMYNWFIALSGQLFTPVGTIMLSVISLLMGVQFILAFLSFDIASVPIRPISGALRSLNTNILI